MDIKKNINNVRQQIQQHAAFNQVVNIVAATKYVDAACIEELAKEGIVMMGENRVEALQEKKEQLQTLPVQWHFIGTLQTKKVKHLINEIEVLHSLDRLNLAKEIQKYRHACLPCFVQVNVSGEDSKHGLALEEVITFIKSLEAFDKIRVIGLMTMAPYFASEDEIRQYFKALKQLQVTVNQLGLSYAPCEHLSMGMSNDYLIAIEEGATHVRLGSVLFET